MQNKRSGSSEPQKRDPLEMAVIGELFLDEQNRYIEHIPEYLFKDQSIKAAAEFLRDNMHLRDIVSVVTEVKKEKVNNGNEIATLLVEASGSVHGAAMLPVHLKQLKEIRRREEIYTIIQRVGAALTAEDIKHIHNLSGEEVSENLQTVSFEELCLKLPQTLEERKKFYSNGVPFPTGLSTFDEFTGGVQKKKVIVVGGRTSIGKTALMTNFAVSVARCRARVLYFNCEMEAREIADRIISSESGVENYKLRYGSLKEDDYKTVTDAISKDNFYKIPLHLCYSPALTLGHIREAISFFKPDIVFLDHIQLLRIKSDNKAQGIGDAMYEIKSIAGDKGIGFVVGSQISRDSVKAKQDTTLEPAYFKGSGGIEEAADVTCELKIADSRKKDDPIWDIILEVNKNRHGRVGQIRLKFYRKNLLFSES